jgi:hypothetical protein
MARDIVKEMLAQILSEPEVVLWLIQTATRVMDREMDNATMQVTCHRKEFSALCVLGGLGLEIVKQTCRQTIQSWGEKLWDDLEKHALTNLTGDALTKRQQELAELRTLVANFNSNGAGNGEEIPPVFIGKRTIA